MRVDWFVDIGRWIGVSYLMRMKSICDIHMVALEGSLLYLVEYSSLVVDISFVFDGW